MEEVPFFRASKKRKLGRQRYDFESGHADPSLHDEPASVSAVSRETRAEDDAEDQTKEQLHVANLIRSRKQKPRHGVQFSNVRSARSGDDPSLSTALVRAPTAADESLNDISGRFTTSTGQVVDVDQHMMAYIDSQIAKRENTAQTGTSHSQGRHEPSNEDHSDLSDESDEQQPTTTKQASSTTVPTHNQPHHLAEVSLANLPAPSSSVQKHHNRPNQPKKPRLGRDGKPMRPRPRKRANSIDQARDRLVEQILAETRLESTYNPTQPGSSTSQPDQAVNDKKGTAGANEDADERMAAEFQRQFMEHVADRQARQQHHNNSTANANKKGPAAGVMDGPKLGGSRSARAKMQAALMAEKDKDRDGKK